MVNKRKSWTQLSSGYNRQHIVLQKINLFIGKVKKVYKIEDLKVVEQKNKLHQW